MFLLTSLVAVPAAHAVDLTLPAEIKILESADFVISAGTANANMILFVSVDGEGMGPCPPALNGTCMDILAPRNLGSAVADANGDVTISWTPPAGAAGFDLSFQAVDTGALAVSPAATQTVLDNVFSFRVSDGPYWLLDPQVLSCVDTCATLFGGVQADWECSTSETVVDNMAKVGEWGVAGCPIVAEDFKQQNPQNPGYDCGSIGCSVSAYVSDNCSVDDTNYCHPL